MIVKMDFVKKLQTLKELTSYSQTALAAELGVSFPTLNSWINGKSTPQERHKDRIDALYVAYVGSDTISDAVLKEQIARLAELQRFYIDPFASILARTDLYQQYVLALTYHTNSIEGSTFNEPEVRAVLFDDVTIPNKTAVEHVEAKNHQAALGYLVRHLRDSSDRIGEGLIKKLHAILMNGILHNAGQYRTHSVRIVGTQVVTTNPQKISAEMEDFMSLYHKKTLDPLQHMAHTHALFERIHPFSDGNGRIGRLLMQAQAYHYKLAPVLVKKEKKRAYYRYLEQAQTKDQTIPLTSFLYDSVFTGYDIL